MAATKTLYLRGMPEDVVRAAKVSAATKGTTLTAVVEAALRAYLDQLPDPRLADIAGDARWFEENKAKLVRRYPGEYVAVVDGRVLDHDPEYAALAPRVHERVGPKPTFIGRCVRDEPPAQIRSPRVVP